MMGRIFMMIVVMMMRERGYRFHTSHFTSNIFSCLAVQSSSICDLVTDSLTHWVTEDFWFWHTKRYPGDLWPLTFDQSDEETSFDNFWQLWHLWTNLTIFETCWPFVHFLTMFTSTDNFENFWTIWQFCFFLTVWTILTIWDNFDNDNPRDLLPLRHWLQFWQLRT